VGKSITLKRLREEIHASHQTLAIHMKVGALASVSAFAARPDPTRQTLAQLAEILVKDYAVALAVPSAESADISGNSIPILSRRPSTRTLAITLIERRLECEARTGRIALLPSDINAEFPWCCFSGCLNPCMPANRVQSVLIDAAHLRFADRAQSDLQSKSLFKSLRLQEMPALTKGQQEGTALGDDMQNRRGRTYPPQFGCWNLIGEE
jgi:hypothetical protein